MKRKSRNLYAGIPAKDVAGVRAYVHVFAGTGKKLTPQEAYVKVLEARKHNAAEQAAQDAQRAKKQRKETRERALKAINPAIGKIATVRDLLSCMERGNILGCSEDDALAARAILNEGAMELEQALFDLGMVEGTKWNWGIEGQFVERLANAPQNAKA